MHVPDGFLSPLLTVPAFVAAAPVWVWSARTRFGPASVESLPVVGSLTAVAFVIQTIMIPVPGGTSTHLLGITLLAILFDPRVAFVCESLVLLLQATLLGAGGVTVLGVNALAMGLLGPLVAWLVYRLLRRIHERAAAFLAAWVALQVSTLAIAGTLALQHHLSPDFFPVPPAVMVASMVVPSVVAGLIEGAYTVVALSILKRANLRGLS
ncbi:MAG: energy-coupling factor ABC transporter permease [Myxococcales bacterium]